MKQIDLKNKNHMHEDDQNSNLSGNKAKKKLIKDIMLLEPTACLNFIAKQFGQDAKAFLLTNLVSFTAYAVKNGFVKAKDIGMSAKDFAKKNKSDNTGIDFDDVTIDEDTMKVKYVIDDNSVKKIKAFLDQYKDQMSNAKEDVESSSEKLQKDIKSSGVKLEGEELADGALAAAAVIDKPENKKLSSKEKQKKVDAAVKTSKSLKKLKDAQKKIDRAASKVKVKEEYSDMDEKQISKLDAEVQQKSKGKSDSSKKNDALRSKIKSAIQKGVAKDFKKSVKTMFVNTSALKKTIAKNMKSGLSIENIEEPRSVCISVQCSKNDFGKILSEADGDITDVTKGSKDKNIQKVIDYIKKVLKSTIGEDKLGDIYAYIKNGETSLLYVFAGVKQDKLDESIILLEATGLTKYMLGVFKANPAAWEAFQKASDSVINGNGSQAFNAFAKQFPDVAKKLIGTGVQANAKRMMLHTALVTMNKQGIGVYDDAMNNISDVASNAKDAVKGAAVATADNATDAAADAASSIPDVSYDEMSKQIANIGSMAKDGIDESEMDAIAGIQGKMQSLTDWASQNSGSTDPLVQKKIAVIMDLNDKLNQQMDNCSDALQADEAASVAERIPDAANNSKEVVKLANNEETKEIAQGWLGKFGKALKTFGQALMVAKIAKLVLNHSKELIDACGSVAVKFKENKDSLGMLTALVNNDEDSDQKYADTRFGVYFSTDDLKWHATNLDDRKMKIDKEDVLVKKVLDTKIGKDFKSKMLKSLDQMFGDGKNKSFVYFIDNYKALGVKINDKDTLKAMKKLADVARDYDEVKKQFS